MSNDLIPTQVAAASLGVSRRHVARLVEKGELTPALKLPGDTGAYLFTPADIAALRQARSAALQEARA